jgi:hypothetical protein
MTEAPIYELFPIPDSCIDSPNNFLHSTNTYNYENTESGGNKLGEYYSSLYRVICKKEEKQ